MIKSNATIEYIYGRACLDAPRQVRDRIRELYCAAIRVDDAHWPFFDCWSTLRQKQTFKRLTLVGWFDIKFKLMLSSKV